MRCEEVKNWLNECNQFDDLKGLPADLGEHTRQCPVCKKLVQAQLKTISSIKRSACLKDESRRRIFSKLQTRIPQIHDDVSTFSFIKVCLSFKWHLAFALIFVLSFWLVSSLNHSSDWKITGSGKILVNEEETKLAEKGLPLETSDRFEIVGGSIRLLRHDREKLVIDGSAGFLFDKDSLKMFKGSAVIAFSPDAKGYRVEMHNSVLEIVGTVLELSVESDHDRIKVVEGKIRWKNLRNEQSGFLDSKSFALKIFNDKFELDTAVKEENKSDSDDSSNSEPQTTQEADLPLDQF